MNATHELVSAALEKIETRSLDLPQAHTWLLQQLSSLVELSPTDESWTREVLVMNLTLRLHSRLHNVDAAHAWMLHTSPAQELIICSVESTDWPRRWLDVGGQFFAGRMIALKSDLIWQQISDFGYPVPPFAGYSRATVQDVQREHAIAFGLLERDTVVRLREIEQPAEIIWPAPLKMWGKPTV
jgi:hypothetical protein